MRFPTLLALLFTTLALPAAAQLGMAGPKIEYTAHTATNVALPGEAVEVAFQFELGDEWHVNSNKPLESFLIPTVLSFPEDERFSVDAVAYPEASLFTFAFSEEPLAVYEHNFVIGAMLQLAPDLEPGDYDIPASLRYQACNDTQCAPPRTIELNLPLTVAAAGTATTPQDAELFAGIDWDQEGTEDEAAAGPEDDSAANLSADWQSKADQFELTATLAGFEQTPGFLHFLDVAEGKAEAEQGLAGRGWLAIAFIVLIGGLALNLTPCVLPLIPINIAIIGAGARAGSKSRGFALGGVYGLGISLVYGALGLVVILGLSNAFGAINSSVWFNAAIAVLFVALGLAMFDIIQIDFSKWQAKFGIRKNENGSFLVAFGMGAISALLAGACVAPVVISALLYSQDQYAQGVTIALLLPFLLGVGMALPWPFAGAGLSFLPKPGMWMEWVKKGFGVFIIALAAYYGYQAYGIWDANNADPEKVLASVREADEDGWLHDLDEALAQGLEQNKPVLVDFWATWCKNCLVMNNTVLKDEEVLARTEDYIKIKFQAEDPSAPGTREVMEYFNVLGLPTYLVLEPK